MNPLLPCLNLTNSLSKSSHDRKHKTLKLKFRVTSTRRRPHLFLCSLPPSLSHPTLSHCPPNMYLPSTAGSGKSSLVYTWWRALSGSVTGKEDFLAEHVHDVSLPLQLQQLEHNQQLADSVLLQVGGEDTNPPHHNSGQDFRTNSTPGHGSRVPCSREMP